MPRIEIQWACPAEGCPEEDWLERCAELALEGTEPAELVLRIVDETEGAALNQRYRKGSGATNVLSFPAELPEGIDLPLLGDVVICARVVAREAESQGKPAAHHWAHMVIHGVLHLRGFDHISSEQARRMEALERKLLAGLGIADPYGVVG